MSISPPWHHSQAGQYFQGDFFDPVIFLSFFFLNTHGGKRVELITNISVNMSQSVISFFQLHPLSMPRCESYMWFAHSRPQALPRPQVFPLTVKEEDRTIRRASFSWRVNCKAAAFRRLILLSPLGDVNAPSLSRMHDGGGDKQHLQKVLCLCVNYVKRRDIFF